LSNALFYYYLTLFHAPSTIELHLVQSDSIGSLPSSCVALLNRPPSTPRQPLHIIQSGSISSLPSFCIALLNRPPSTPRQPLHIIQSGSISSLPSSLHCAAEQTSFNTTSASAYFPRVGQNHTIYKYIRFTYGSFSKKIAMHTVIYGAVT